MTIVVDLHSREIQEDIYTSSLMVEKYTGTNGVLSQGEEVGLQLRHYRELFFTLPTYLAVCRMQDRVTFASPPYSGRVNFSWNVGSMALGSGQA